MVCLKPLQGQKVNKKVRDIESVLSVIGEREQHLKTYVAIKKTQYTFSIKRTEAQKRQRFPNCSRGTLGQQRYSDFSKETQ